MNDLKHTSRSSQAVNISERKPSTIILKLKDTVATRLAERKEAVK